MNKCDACKYYMSPLCEKCKDKEYWKISLLLVLSAIFFAFGISGILIFIWNLL